MGVVGSLFQAGGVRFIRQNLPAACFYWRFYNCALLWLLIITFYWAIEEFALCMISYKAMFPPAWRSWRSCHCSTPPSSEPPTFPPVVVPTLHPVRHLVLSAWGVHGNSGFPRASFTRLCCLQAHREKVSLEDTLGGSSFTASAKSSRQCMQGYRVTKADTKPNAALWASREGDSGKYAAVECILGVQWMDGWVGGPQREISVGRRRVVPCCCPPILSHASLQGGKQSTSERWSGEKRTHLQNTFTHKVPRVNPELTSGARARQG